MGDLLGEPVWLLLAAEERPVAEQLVRELLAREQEEVVFEARCMAQEASRWVEVHLRRAPAPDQGLSGTLVDVTERRRSEAEREHLREQEQAARAEAAAMRTVDRLKTEFVNAVSHELRTPLTAIRGYSEFLEDGIGGVLPLEQQGYVARIVEGTSRLQRLVDDLLDFARLEAGTFALRWQEADLGQLLRGMVRSAEPQALAVRVRLSCRLGEGDLRGPMDPQRIEQVVANLLGNALKFSEPGGQVEVVAARQGNRLRVEVTDNGPGIAPAEVPRLFQRFAQLEAGLRKAGGTGLGLSIARALVEAHGGAIGVLSRPGEGSTFWFELPLTAPARPA